MRPRGWYVDGPWGQVHVRLVGDGTGPSIALFHESPLSARVFDAVLNRIEEPRTAVAFDTPGYGASDPPPSPGQEIPDYARVLLGAVDALGIESFVAAGGHTGAALAIEVARQAGPGRVPGVVLSGVPLFGEEERQQFLASWAPDVAPDADGSQFGWAVERYQRVWGPHVPADLLHLAVVELSRSLGRYSWAYNACFRYDPGPALAALACQVLLLDAEHDMFADRDQQVLDLVRDGRLVVLDGLPGQPHLREPERYARELTAFAREVLSAIP